jgi:hypothetical protein
VLIPISSEVADMLTTPVPAGTKLAGISNAFGEEVQSSRLVMGETADTPVGPDAPLPVEYPALLAAIEAMGGLPSGAATNAELELIRALLAGTLTVGLPTGAATQATLLDLLAKLPASLGAKAASGSLSIIPATGADLATGTLQTTANTTLAQIVTLLTSEGGYLDGVEALLTTIGNALAATLNVLPLIKPWTAWAPATANDMRNYAGVEIQVTATAAATFTRSADDATYVPISASVAGAASASPLAPGFYSLKGGGFLKWAGTGTILIRGYN